MQEFVCKIINTSPYPLPSYQTEGAAGMDLYANINEVLELLPLQRLLIPTGIFIELPNGFEAQIRPRSGLALKYGVTILNAPSTIDADYRGEIKLILINLSNETFQILPGMRIAQLVVAQYSRVVWEQCTELSNTLRGSGGLGYTGLS